MHTFFGPVMGSAKFAVFSYATLWYLRMGVMIRAFTIDVYMYMQYLLTNLSCHNPEHSGVYAVLTHQSTLS